MSLEIERTRPKRRDAWQSSPARPSAPPPARPLESFCAPPPRCRWPEGCYQPADTWHLLYYCEAHKEQERREREERLRAWSSPIDQMLAASLYRLKRKAGRTLPPIRPQDALSPADAYHRTPGEGA